MQFFIDGAEATERDAYGYFAEGYMLDGGDLDSVPAIWESFKLSEETRDAYNYGVEIIAI